MTIPCNTCEMQHSCTRDKRCWVPKTLEYWNKEVREAAEALKVAATRLNTAAAGWKQAAERELQS